MDCHNCKDTNNYVPYIVHEADMARMERNVKRLWIALILVIVLLVGSNIAWITYESQFEDVVTIQEVEQDTDGGGNNHFVGGDYYGSAESTNNNSTQNP